MAEISPSEGVSEAYGFSVSGFSAADGSADGYFGKAIVPRAHSHVVVVARQPDPKTPDRPDEKKFYPIGPQEWGHRRTYTE